MPPDPDRAAALIRLFEEGIPFNRWLGLRVEGLGPPCVISLPHRPEWIGDPRRPALHGGLLSTLVDTAGGLAVFAALGDPRARVSTIDLHLDCYAPADPADLRAEADIANLGNRVAVAHIRVLQGDRLVAGGRAAYYVGRAG